VRDETWRRHANPWSVWTRFAAIPPLVLSIWSRTWIGWWCLVPLALVIVWLIVNPSAFAPVEKPVRWTERGIYGERIWAQDKDIPQEHKRVLGLLLGLAAIGAVLLALGLITLSVWPTVFGATLVVVTQLWRIDRFATLYDTKSASPQ
jgi:Family of unknown function (DUF6653)